MSKAMAYLRRDSREEAKKLEKDAAKKDLWSSIGRTAGTLGVMALTGGAVNPLTLGALTAGASFLGGAAGAKLSKTGDLREKGSFYKGSRDELQTELGAFGTKNLTSSLKSGVQAGLGQAAKLRKPGAPEMATEGIGVDFSNSMVGKKWDYMATPYRSQEALGGKSLRDFIDPDLQTGQGDRPIVAMDRRKYIVGDYSMINALEYERPSWQEKLFESIGLNDFRNNSTYRGER